MHRHFMICGLFLLAFGVCMVTASKLCPAKHLEGPNPPAPAGRSLGDELRAATKAYQRRWYTKQLEKITEQCRRVAYEGRSETHTQLVDDNLKSLTIDQKLAIADHFHDQGLRYELTGDQLTLSW